MPSKKEPVEPAKKKVAAKLFDDVKRPNETPAQATSKPVITGHINIIKRDPMVSPTNNVAINVVDDKQDTETSKKPDEEIVEQKPRRELKIQPLSEQEKGSSEDQEKPDISEQPEDQKSSDDNVQVGQQLEKDEEIDDFDADNSAGAIDAIVDNVSTKKELDLEAKKQTELQQEIDKLVSSKDYFVKISDTPNKRTAKILIGLVVAVLLLAIVWYFYAGPGKEVWSKSVNSSTSTQVAQVKQQTNSDNRSEQKIQSVTKNYSSTNNGIVFDYPNSWLLDELKDTARQDVNIITLSSPKFNLDMKDDKNEKVSSEVNTRVKIYIQPAKYTNALSAKACYSEDIIVTGKNMTLSLLDGASDVTKISSSTLTKTNCLLGANKEYSIDNQVQLSSKMPDMRYVIVQDYVYTADYLKKLNPDMTSKDLAANQDSGLLLDKDEFTGTGDYLLFKKILESIKAL